MITAPALVVIAAARAAAAGADIKEVARVAKDTIPKVHTFFAPEDLRHFKRLGRFIMPGVSEEELLKIRPILTFRDGGIRLAEQCTPDRTVVRIRELVKENAKTTSPLHVGVFHADAAEAAAEMKQYIVSNIECAELFVSNMSPVVGAHVGPGTLGVSFYNE